MYQLILPFLPQQGQLFRLVFHVFRELFTKEKPASQEAGQHHKRYLIFSNRISTGMIATISAHFALYFRNTIIEAISKQLLDTMDAAFRKPAACKIPDKPDDKLHKAKINHKTLSILSGESAVFLWHRIPNRKVTAAISRRKISNATL